MKKGRHRRFEEARALKRDPGSTEEDFSSWLSDNDNISRPIDDDDLPDDLVSKYLDDDEDETDATDGPSKK